MNDFEDLYRAEYQPMVRLARLLIGSLSLAEEVVQEAFVAVHGRFDGIDNPGAYLRRTVVNNSYGQLRRNGLEHQKLRLASGAGDTPVLPPDLDETWRALEVLNPKQRTAVVLRYYEDLRIRDIGDLMNEREGTVKSLVHRGLQRLREELNHDDSHHE